MIFVVSGFCVIFVLSNSSSFIKQQSTMFKTQFFNYRKGDNIIRFKVGPSGNQKITLSNSPIVESYTFSRKQLEYVRQVGSKLFGIIDHDHTNCMNCPFSKSQGYSGGAKCYTHKHPQLRAFHSILKSLVREYPTFESIPEVDGENVPAELLKAVQGKYVRFGTYGEPVVIPFKWVSEICRVAKNWTSYTHQWANPDYQDFKGYFMASVHNPEQAEIASAMGWRYFETFEKGQTPSAASILCPADGKKVSCQTCGLCSGTIGKNAKSVNIKLH